jgi:hypothetical protein
MRSLHLAHSFHFRVSERALDARKIFDFSAIKNSTARILEVIKESRALKGAVSSDSST